MKLVSFQIATPEGARVRIGALDDVGRVVHLALAYRLSLQERGLSQDAAGRVADALLPGDMVDFLEGGAVSRSAAEEALEWAGTKGSDKGSGRERVHCARPEIRMLPPLPDPPLIRDFMAFESHLLNIFPKLGRDIPSEWYNLPVYYKGNPASIATHDDDISIPSFGEEVLDFEFELAAVIGSGGTNIPRERALEHVFGYMIYNDFSARGIQGREMSVGLGPAKGKDFERGHVFGPCLVTADEIPNPYDLRMVARINGEICCQGNTATMHWKFEDMIAHASWDEELRTGEILGSGTVGGGSGAELGRYLKRGDMVELEVEKLGILRNRVV